MKKGGKGDGDGHTRTLEKGKAGSMKMGDEEQRMGEKD